MGWILFILLLIFVIVSYPHVFMTVVMAIVGGVILLYIWSNSQEERERRIKEEAEKAAQEYFQVWSSLQTLREICYWFTDSYARYFTKPESQALRNLWGRIQDFLSSQPLHYEIETRKVTLDLEKTKALFESKQREWSQELQGIIQERNRRVSQSGLYLAQQKLRYVESYPLDLVIPESQRFKHTYIIGKTGAGKTNLLLNWILQDLERGHGLAVLAPDKDFFESKLLPRIPEHRMEDIIYFDPTDQKRPVCFNPFDLEKGEDLDLRAEDTITIFSRAMADLSAASRAQAILRNSIYGLLQLEGANLLDLPQLLDPLDPSLRERLIRDKRVDATTRRFFATTYPSYPKDAHLPILNRLDPFLRGKLAQTLAASSFDFWEAIEAGKVFLANLSTGLLGQTPAQLLGQLIVSKFLTVIMKRDALPEDQRTPYYLYIDEFQTFTQYAADTYGELLARARKYRLGLILVHQHTKQLPPELLEEILGNVATILALQLGDRDASRFKSIFYTGPDPQEAKRVQSDLQELPVGTAYAKLGRWTYEWIQIPLVETRISAKRARRVKALSRQRFGRAVDIQAARPAPTWAEQQLAEETELYPEDWTNPEPS